MHIVELRHLFAYTRWVTDRLLTAATRLPPDRFAADAPLFPDGRGLRSTLAHELEAEESWRLSLHGTAWEDLRDIHPEGLTLDSLADAFQREHELTDTWLESLTDDDLAAEVTPSISGRRRPLWQYLVHVVAHASQQNADAAMLLSAAGVDPANIDYSNWLQSTES